MDCSMPGCLVHHQLLEFMSITHGNSCPSHSLSSLLLLPSIFPSIRILSIKSALRIRWPKHWSFSFNISPSSEHPGLISFRIDWLDLLAVQGTLRSLLQYYSSKASILRCSAFFTVQLSHPYMTTGKTIALTRQTFVGKVMCLLLNMLSRLVIPFVPRSKHLLISWLQSPSAVILEPRKTKSATVSTVSLSICHEVMGPDAMILVFWMLSFKPTFKHWSSPVLYSEHYSGRFTKPDLWVDSVGCCSFLFVLIVVLRVTAACPFSLTLLMVQAELAGREDSSPSGHPNSQLSFRSSCQFHVSPLLLLPVPTDWLSQTWIQ